MQKYTMITSLLTSTRLRSTASALCAAGILFVTGTAVAAAPARWNGQHTVNGQVYDVAFATEGDGHAAEVIVKDSTGTKLAALKITAAQGLDNAITLACHAHDLIGKGKTAVGCLSTAASGVCMFTGAGGGVGAAFCVATIEYTAKDGAIDCLSGLKDYFAEELGNHADFFAVPNLPISPSDLVDKAIDAACKSWETSYKK